MVFVYLFLKRYEGQISTGLGFFIYLLLFYNTSLNVVRQGIAIPIILYSFKFIDDRKPVSYLLFVLIAGSFHISSIVVLPFYYLFHLSN